MTTTDTRTATARPGAIYLLNTWYMAAWASEVDDGALLARRLLDQPVVMFRDAQGVPRALHDRCPHRFVPLSTGRRMAETGTLQCGYHGLQFDGTGKCVHNPHGAGVIPAAARVRSYPLVERYSGLWIWMGEPAQADPDLIPDFSCMDPQTWYVGQGYLRPRANYQLEVDNILDLSHLQFVHPNSLGSDAVDQAQTEVRQEGSSIWSTRFIQDELLPDLASDQFQVPRGMRIDRWLDVRWDAPACMLLIGMAAPTGRPRSEYVGLNFMAPHIFTPETATTSHYFLSMCMPKSEGPHAADMVKHAIAGMGQTFDREDTPMLEIQQASIGDEDFWSLKPVLLTGDAAGVRVRRQLDGLIRAEQAALAPQDRAA